MLVNVPLCEIYDVLAVVPVLRKRDVLPAELAYACLDAEREIENLRARVVVVELSRHAPAGRREQRADRIAQRRLPPMSDMQGTGWIRRNEFDVDRTPLPRARAA